MKKAVLTSILLIASASVLLACTDRSANANQTETPIAGVSPDDPAAAKSPAAPDKVVAYYFHGNRRCPTCVGMQATIEETIMDRFAAELSSGAVVFQEVNFEAPENKHFVKTYKLGFSTLVVAAKDGKSDVKWENCKDVWKHAHDRPALAAYTEKQVRAYLALLEKK